MIVNCPSCGKENPLNAGMCSECSTDLVAGPQPQAKDSELPVGQTVPVGEGFVATARQDGSVHLALSEETSEQTRKQSVAAGWVLLILGVGGIVAGIVVAVTGAMDTMNVIGIMGLGIFLAICGFFGLRGGTEDSHADKWIARKGSLTVEESKFGKLKSRHYSDGVLFARYSGVRHSRSLVLMIKHSGGTDTIYDSNSAHQNNKPKRLGEIIAYETGFKYEERDPGYMMSPVLSAVKHAIDDKDR